MHRSKKSGRGRGRIVITVPGVLERIAGRAREMSWERLPDISESDRDVFVQDALAEFSRAMGDSWRPGEDPEADAKAKEHEGLLHSIVDFRSRDLLRTRGRSSVPGRNAGEDRTVDVTSAGGQEMEWRLAQFRRNAERAKRAAMRGAASLDAGTPHGPAAPSDDQDASNLERREEEQKKVAAAHTLVASVLGQMRAKCERMKDCPSRTRGLKAIEVREKMLVEWMSRVGRGLPVNYAELGREFLGTANRKTVAKHFAAVFEAVRQRVRPRDVG